MSEKKRAPVVTEKKPETEPKVDSEPVQAPAQTSEAAAPKFVSIVDIIKALPDDKLQAADQLGIPFRPLLQWAYGIEQLVRQMGANMPTDEGIAEALKQKLGGAQPAGSPNPNAAGLGQLLPQILGLLGGGGGGLSEGDRYFMEIGREMAGLGSFMTKELLKKMIPEAMVSFEASRKPPEAK